MTQVVLALVLGVLFAVGTFLMLRRDVVRVVWGVAIVSQAANVYLVTMGGLGGSAPILGHGGTPDPTTITDPLVQALVLTAIVIGFGTTALALVLTYRLYEEHGTIDLREVGHVDEQSNVAGEGAVADGGVTDDGVAGGESGDNRGSDERADRSTAAETTAPSQLPGRRGGERE